MLMASARYLQANQTEPEDIPPQMDQTSILEGQTSYQALDAGNAAAPSPSGLNSGN